MHAKKGDEGKCFDDMTGWMDGLLCEMAKVWSLSISESVS